MKTNRCYIWTNPKFIWTMINQVNSRGEKSLWNLGLDIPVLQSALKKSTLVQRNVYESIHEVLLR